MDEFAQTRQPDNLFDDDFTPISVEPAVQEAAPRRNHTLGRNSNPSSSNSRPMAKPTDSEEVSKTPNTEPASRAVRGDRSATGGITKPKLTEEELSARLEAVKLNNARREAAHRLAEADEASFQKQEAQEIQKRKELGVAREAMEKEREKNRLRKLGAQAGREWDEGKEDEPIRSPGESQYRRGVHGGIAYSGGNRRDKVNTNWHQDNSQQGGWGENVDREPWNAGPVSFARRDGRGRENRSWQQHSGQNEDWQTKRGNQDSEKAYEWQEDSGQQTDGQQYSTWQEDKIPQNSWAERGGRDQGGDGRGEFAQRGRGRGRGNRGDRGRGGRGGRGRGNFGNEGGSGHYENISSNRNPSGPPAAGLDAFPPLPTSFSRPASTTSSNGPSYTVPPTTTFNTSNEMKADTNTNTNTKSKNNINNNNAKDRGNAFSPVAHDSSWADQVEDVDGRW